MIDVSKGKMVVFVGLIGFGKIIVMNFFNCFYNVDGGVIFFDDIDICDICLDFFCK